MFTVQFGDLSYKVSFRHTLLKSKEDGYRLINTFLSERFAEKLTNDERSKLSKYLINPNGKSRYKTRCRIVVSSDNFEQVFEETTTCNPCDITEKNIGKKYALQNLLSTIKDDGLFPRELRSILYQTLFENFPGSELSPNCKA